MDKHTSTVQRLAWMDVLRGLLIILVVLGHSTGIYNKYIYQFHMGAFFLVSGYMSTPERRSPLHTLYHRFLTTYLPIFSATVFLAAATAVMRRVGLYSIFLGDSLYLGFLPTIKHLLLYGNLYVWWLGAGWFLLVLFGVSIVNRVMLRLCGDTYSWLYIVSSLLMFVLGYGLAGTGGVRYSVDLILIAQFYFMLGTLVRKNCQLNPEKNSVAVNLCGVLITVFLMWGIAWKFGLTVDYPDRKFNTPITDAAMSLNGTLCFYFLSALLCKIPPVKRILQAVGKNTLPIVLFHFIWFNLGYILLYLAGFAPFEYLQSFTPGDIGAPWWPMFTLIGTGCSILTWKVMMLFRPLRVLFGQEKQLYDRIWWWINEKSASAKWKKRLLGHPHYRKRYSTVHLLLHKKALILLCCFGFVAGIFFVHDREMRASYVGNTLETCRIQSGIYEDGWCESSAQVDIQTGETGVIYLEGWYGQPLSGDEQITVFCNGTELTQYNLTSENISFEIPAPANAAVILTIHTNFAYPVTPPDTRNLAFIISKLDAK